MANSNSDVIIILCSQMCTGENTIPLSNREWYSYAIKLNAANKNPSDILTFSDEDFRSILMTDGQELERIHRLLDRSASLTFERNKYEDMGIGIFTRADDFYPRSLKTKLKDKAPAMFYYAGNPALLDEAAVGFVGSRNIAYEDSVFTVATVNKICRDSYNVVSGGAKGVDEISADAAIAAGCSAVEFVSDSLIKKIRKPEVLKNIYDGTVLLASETKPDAGFAVGLAMARNKLIYSFSKATIAIKSDYKKGGTWAGATENLRHNWTPLYCWENEAYKGNTELIRLGAIPINKEWEGIPKDQIKATPTTFVTVEADSSQTFETTSPEKQMNLFDEMS